MWRTLEEKDRTFEPPFSLHIKRDGLICMREDYVNDADPSGYKTSTRLLGDFGYWKYLMRAGWFRDAVKEWNDELEAKLYSEGLTKIRTIAASEDKGALAAARYLADRGFKLDKTKSTRGRPSAEEVEGKLKEEARELSEHEEDAARIGLSIVKGNK